MTVTDPKKPRCHAHNRLGLACGMVSVPGGTVCRYHGGRSPQAQAKAEERMRSLVHPAISSLARQIDNNEFAATKFVLEWAGFRTPVEVKSDSEITIRLVRSEQPIITSVRALEDGA